MAWSLLHLRDYMRREHSAALADMVRHARTSLIERLLATRRARLELILLEKACRDPERFPAHVWADAEVVRLVHEIRQRGTGMPCGGGGLYSGSTF